jgi:hypothetical protein
MQIDEVCGDEEKLGMAVSVSTTTGIDCGCRRTGLELPPKHFFKESEFFDEESKLFVYASDSFPACSFSAGLSSTCTTSNYVYVISC